MFKETRIAVFTMLRDEASVLDPFCDQIDEFFDEIFVVDHRSVDGTAGIISGRCERARIFVCRHDGYPQSELATILSRHIFETTDVDFLFFLDADEYLPFRNRAELLRRLNENRGNPILHLNWRNIAPIDFRDADAFSRGFVMNKELSPFTKIVLSRDAPWGSSTFVVSQGYHIAALDGAMLPSTSISDVGLLHMPVQGLAKYEKKIRNSAAVIENDRRLVGAGLGGHWISHRDILENEKNLSNIISDIALQYPDAERSSAKERTYCEFNFPYIKSKFDFGKLTYRAEKDLSEDTMLFHEELNLHEILSKDRMIKEEGMKNKRVGAEISPRMTGDFYDQLIEPLFSLPKALPLTAWKGHIPFLFALIRATRPRNYVELGVHYGASLIAAATAAQAYNCETAIYGIDTWQGDEHAGQYDGDQTYSNLAGFVAGSFERVSLLREFFEEARPKFADGTVDLLHIDGLHTYEAVKSDFDTWLSAMSDRGIILFHDTTVFDRGFGVWKLWSELREHYPSLEFGHSHGLGVLFVGRNALSTHILQVSR